MNARTEHLKKIQDKRDAQQDRVPPIVLFGTVRRARQNSHKGYQKYGILDIMIREPALCDHEVRITLEDQGKVKKRRTVHET